LLRHAAVAAGLTTAGVLGWSLFESQWVEFREEEVRLPSLAPEQRQNREMLVDVMRRHGFKNYDKEWWHYTLENEPFPSTIFDFPIEPRGSSK